MASLLRYINKFSSLARGSSSPLQLSTPTVTQVRFTRYAPAYLDPTLEGKDQAKNLEEEDNRRYQPIKASQNTDNTSLNTDQLVTKFTKMFIKEGNGERARHLMDKTLEHIKLVQLERYHNAKTDQERERIWLDAKAVMKDAIRNCQPLLIIQRVRRGGISYQVPIPAKPNYQRFKSMTWLIQAANDKPRTMRFYEKLAHELIDAANNEGRAIKMKQDLHRICESNRAYAHFRW